MKIFASFRLRLTQLSELYSQFGEIVQRERKLLFLAALALAGEVGMGLLAPWPMKYLVDGLLDPSKGKKLYFVPTDFPPQHPQLYVSLICVAVLAIALVGGTCAFRRQLWAATAGQRMVIKLRKRLYQHLQTLSLRFHHGSRLGDLLLRITGDIPVLRDVLSESLIDLIGRFVYAIVTICIMFALDAKLAIVSLVSLFAVAGLSTLFGRRIAKVTRKQREKEGVVAYTAAESLSAMILIKAFGLEEVMIERFSRQNRSSMRQGLKGTRLQASLSRWVEAVFSGGTAIVLAFGALRVLDASSGFSVGDLLVFVSYVRNLNKPLRKISRTSSRIGKASACGHRILEILNIEPEEVDRPGAVEAPPLAGKISFRGVTFGYDAAQPILRGLDLTIQPGERIAIVGRNGAGKTTLVSLVLRFFEPDDGVLLFDDRDCRDFTIASLRGQISLSLQDTYILGGSIRDNLALAAPRASDEEMLHALQRVGATFVTRNSEGLDTELAEGGVNLSGGERRKLALAGAILRPASIMILDEPTTHIDAATRDDLLGLLPEITRGRTTLIVTHDPDLLTALDRSVYIENGTVIAEGRHEELRLSSPRYRSLFPSFEEEDAAR